MRTRLTLWSAILTLHLLSILHPPEAIAPAIAASIYLPLIPLQTIGIQGIATGDSGGWGAPSLSGWIAIAVFWSLAWWLLIALVSRIARKPATNI